MNKEFRIEIIGENEIRILSRILIILNRRNIKIDYIKTNKTNKTNIKYIIDFKYDNNKLIKIVKSIKKIIGIINICCYKIKEKKFKKLDTQKILE